MLTHCEKKKHFPTSKPERVDVFSDCSNCIANELKQFLLGPLSRLEEHSCMFNAQEISTIEFQGSDRK